jgi:ABC-type sugar transport system ATPase subunit
LRDGKLEVEAGEVHLLMGENGAGKSTLMKIVAGMLTSDSGEMLWKGSPVRFTKPSEASAMGIAMVHQESLLFPHLTVAENIFLGQSANRHKMMEGARAPHRRAQTSHSMRVLTWTSLSPRASNWWRSAAPFNEERAS